MGVVKARLILSLFITCRSLLLILQQPTTLLPFLPTTDPIATILTSITSPVGLIHLNVWECLGSSLELLRIFRHLGSSSGGGAGGSGRGRGLSGKCLLGEGSEVQVVEEWLTGLFQVGLAGLRWQR